MTFADCVASAVDEGSVDRERGERAQRLWRDLSDRYERQGRPRHVAEALAAEDVKAAFRKEAGEVRHVFLAQAAAARRAAARVESSPHLASLMSDTLEHNAASPNPEVSVIGQQRALVRAFHHRLAAVIKEHSRDLLGRVRNPAKLEAVVRELHGESTGDVAAYAVADAVRRAFDDMRLAFNEAGGVIGKLENWGLPHTHNRSALRRAGFDAWAAEVAPRLAWDRMPDDLTGRPLAEAGDVPPAEVRNTVLREVYDNIIFGRGTDEPSGAPEGEALWRRRAHERVLPFRSADDWIAYNKRFGTGDPFSSIIGHAHRMARDIALMREFGPSPDAGFRTMERLAMQRAREIGDPALASRIEGSAEHGRRMLRIMNGSLVPAGPFQEAVAGFMSTTRHVLTAAFLDRAILASISDMNTMRMAASAVGMNPANVISRHVDLLANSLSREEAARAGWIADTLADPGLALARFQSEVPPAEFAERLSSAVLRVQGLAHWTDQARIAFQMEMAGLFAANAGRSLSEVQPELAGLLRRAGITDAEWLEFTKPETLFTTTNGATFASPIYWRQATDLPKEQADSLFLKLQGLVEEQTEFAVPTQSVWARAFVEGGMPPGSIGYELAKSGLAFKNFPLTFTVNQVRRVLSIPTTSGRLAYVFDLAAGATVLGALSLQILEIAQGNDPRDMTRPEFWAAAALRGGAFGMLGDLGDAATGPFGGLAGYAGGPVLGAAQDLADLATRTAGNLADGDLGSIGSDALKFANRYLPGGDIPVLGVALDRMFFDRLMVVLDPEAADALVRAAQNRERRTGADAWWMPGVSAPRRAPNLASALGGQ